MNDVSPPAASAIDLDACAREPIRIPGAIQPHGALMILDPRTLQVLNVSANVAAFTGLELSPGRSLHEAPEARALVAELDRWSKADEPNFLRTLAVGERLLQVIGLLGPQGLLLEFEDPPAPDEMLEALYPRLRRFLQSLQTATDVRSIGQVAVREIRALTGFDRALFYAFDPRSGDGTVMGEDGNGVLPSYLGLRFPASDVPAQARELYKRNRIRLIPDAGYAPVPIHPPLSPVDGRPLDLSDAALRSVSPVHLEYMRNMGTGASMSISILVEGELWGLISAHNAEPRRLNAQVRTACDMLGQVLSFSLEARVTATRTAQRLELKQVETDLLAKLGLAPSFQRGLQENAETWLGLTAAAGAAVVTGGQILSTGLTPSVEEIQRIVGWVEDRPEELLAIDSMAEVWPEAAAFANLASGLLAVSISRLHADYILWFRPEVVQTVEWGGDPNKPVEPDSGRLSPRRSFATWTEQVRLKAEPWSEAQIDSARGFRNAIQDFVLQRAEERAELTGRLERTNKELESFSYSISHDLRAPFRHIVGYAELLGERAKSLDEKSRHYLTSITEAALSAGRLVDDLLQFSQLGRSTMNQGRIDMAKTVAEVLKSMTPDLHGRRIEWRVGELPAAFGDGAMVRQVLQNLIENAVKYSGPRDPAVITIEGQARGDVAAYTVSDNGVGFDMNYVSKLFGVFQRLHRTEDFEGTGIGLALAKRIVDRHGGTITASSVLGQGASFTFTLPSRGQEKEGIKTRG